MTKKSRDRRVYIRKVHKNHTTSLYERFMVMWNEDSLGLMPDDRLIAELKKIDRMCNLQFRTKEELQQSRSSAYKYLLP